MTIRGYMARLSLGAHHPRGGSVGGPGSLCIGSGPKRYELTGERRKQLRVMADVLGPRAERA